MDCNQQEVHYAGVVLFVEHGGIPIRKGKLDSFRPLQIINIK